MNKFNRIKKLMEYSYYTPKKTVLDEDGEQDDLGMDSPELSNLEQQAGLNNEEEPNQDMSEKPNEEPEDLENVEDSLGDGGAQDEPSMDSDQSEEEVEIDISELVDQQEETSEAIEAINSKIEDLSSGFGKYLDKVVNLADDVTKKMADVEDRIRKELVKRNPTPNEKMKLQSVYSYPFDQKLTDYWEVPEKETNQKFDIQVDKEEKEENPEYVLTQKDIDSDFSDVEIEKYF